LIEYLYDAIRVSSGSEATITARITEEDGACITDLCQLMLFDGDEMVGCYDGELFSDEALMEDLWLFTIPASDTAWYIGRYWYCVCCGGKNLCFKTPIYFV
jgi:hypothetical protein